MENKRNPLEGSRQEVMEVILQDTSCQVLMPERILQHSSEDPPLQLFSSEPYPDDSPVQAIRIGASRPTSDSTLKYQAEIELNKAIFGSEEEFRDLMNAIAPASDRLNRVEGVYFSQVEHTKIIKIESESGAEFAAVFGFDDGVPRIFISNDMRIVNAQEVPIYDVELGKDTSREGAYMQDFLIAFMHVIRAVPHTIALSNERYAAFSRERQKFELIPVPITEPVRYDAEDALPRVITDNEAFKRYMQSLLPQNHSVDYGASECVADVPGVQRGVLFSFNEIKHYFLDALDGGAIRPRAVVLETEDTERAYEYVEAFARDISAWFIRKKGSELYGRSSRTQEEKLRQLKAEIHSVNDDKPVVLFIDDLRSAVARKGSSRRGATVLNEVLPVLFKEKPNLIVFGQTERLMDIDFWNSNSFNWQVVLPEVTEHEMREVICAQLAQIILRCLSSGEESYIVLASKKRKEAEGMFRTGSLSRIALKHGLTVTELRSAINAAESAKQDEANARPLSRRNIQPVRARDIVEAVKKVAKAKRGHD